MVEQYSLCRVTLLSIICPLGETRWETSPARHSLLWLCLKLGMSLHKGSSTLDRGGATRHDRIVSWGLCLEGRASSRQAKKLLAAEETGERKNGKWYTSFIHVNNTPLIFTASLDMLGLIMLFAIRDASKERKLHHRHEEIRTPVLKSWLIRRRLSRTPECPDRNMQLQALTTFSVKCSHKIEVQPNVKTKGK